MKKYNLKKLTISALDISVTERSFKTSTEVGTIWEENAELWITLTESGFDVYRDYINTPAFLALLPNVKRLKGLDIGCGTGHNTRMVAKQGAIMTGIDISKKMISFATKKENSEQLGIKYINGNVIKLPFKSNSFDFAVSFHCIMDVPEYEQALSESFRVLKPGGFFQFSIPHPCFWTHNPEWTYNEDGKKNALICRDYFTTSEGVISRWTFDGVDTKSNKNKKLLETPIFRRTLKQWVCALVNIGFIIKEMDEPRPLEKTVKKFPAFDGCRIVPYSLIIRCEKPNNPL